MVRSSQICIDKSGVDRATAIGVDAAAVVAFFQYDVDKSATALVGIAGWSNTREFYFLNVLGREAVYLAHRCGPAVDEDIRRSSVDRHGLVYRIDDKSGHRELLKQFYRGRRGLDFRGRGVYDPGQGGETGGGVGAESVYEIKSGKKKNPQVSKSNYI